MFSQLKNELVCKNIVIEPTNVCNAECVFCPREMYKHKLHHMPQNIFQKIIEEANELGLESVGFGGFGEPLCDPKLIKKMEIIKKKNKRLKIFLTSTLSLLDKKKIHYFVENVDVIHVSFYGTAPKSYEKRHGGKLKFEKSKKNIISLIKQKKDKNSKKPYIVMRYLFDDSVDEMKEFISFWEPQVEEVMVWKPHNYLYGRKYRTVQKNNKGNCGRPFSNGLNFDIEGRVTVCCFDFNKELEIGNITTQSIKEILLGGKLNRLKMLHEKKQFDGLLCDMCDQRIKNPDVLVYSTDNTRTINSLNLSRQDYKTA